MKVLIYLLCSFIFTTAFAQEENSWKLFPGKQNKVEGSDTLPKELESPKTNININSVSQQEVREGYIEIRQDERIKALLEKQIRINEQNKTLNGFRVQLFSGAGPNMQNDANKVKAQFLQLFEGNTAYVIYDLPNWKVRVGDFRTRLEAEKFLSLIQLEFQNSFVVSDKINFPDLR